MAFGEMESRAAIVSTAFGLMLTEGYRKTTYERIAAESGQEPSLLTYYFPTKGDLAVELVCEVMRRITAELEEAGLFGEEPEVRVMQADQVYYAFLLHDEASRRFTHEILTDRSITGRIVSTDAKETIPLYAENSTEADEEAVREAGIKATGGLYEVLRLRIEEGRSSDPADLSAQSTAAFLAFIGSCSYVQGYERCMRERLDEDAVDDLVAKLRAALLA
jgi:AcrR family transcriptional regulator